MYYIRKKYEPWEGGRMPPSPLPLQIRPCYEAIRDTQHTFHNAHTQVSPVSMLRLHDVNE
jgi:hypothetical protein